MNGRPTAAAAGKIDVGGELTVNRLGFGAMRITGTGIWGDPPDRDRAKEALRRAVALDVTVSVQNRYNVADRSSEPMLDLCDQEMLVFIPWAPIEATGAIPALMAAARRRGVTERQVALAWLLTRSPQVLPIPGSGNPEHVEENVAAASIELAAEEIRAITLAVLSR
jgi:aryl-alcohol dehydrogenase-like predicted oxidoreductase